MLRAWDLGGDEEDGALGVFLSVRSGLRLQEEESPNLRQLMTFRSMRRQYRKLRKNERPRDDPGILLLLLDDLHRHVPLPLQLGLGLLPHLVVHAVRRRSRGRSQEHEVTDILGNMPDPTQFGIHGDVLEMEKLEYCDVSSVTELGRMAVGDQAEMELMTELMNIQPRRDGGKHGMEPGWETCPR